MAQSDSTVTGAWNSLMAHGTISESVRPVIQESWQRVRGRVAPDRKPPVTQEASGIWEPLGADPAPYLEQLDSWVKDTRHLVALTTPSGILAQVAGDSAVRAKAEQTIHFVAGADYGELSAGTNAIGTALATGQAVTVRGAEHFIAPFHGWICTAAPIWDRATGQLLGSIDITGPQYDNPRHPAATLIQMLSSMIADIRHAATAEQREWLQTQFGQYAARYQSDTLWLLDGQGRFLAATGTKPGSSDLQVLQCAVQNGSRSVRLSSGSPADVIPLRRGDAVQGWVIIQYPDQTTSSSSPQVWHARYGRGDLIGVHPAYRNLIQQIDQVAPTPVPVLLYGETGVGKERVAHALHHASSRREGPFVAVNCGAIPTDLVGPELFGYEGGAFTGAKPDGGPGKFEAAQHGTIFLDEIGELPLAVQPYLLRILETRELVRVGGRAPIPLDVRIIAATHQDLRGAQGSAPFRSDLYYRLAVVELTVPPLRERISDIPLLAHYFLQEASISLGQSGLGLNDAAVSVLTRYAWPGNLRELRNVLYRCAIFSPGTTITPEIIYQCAPSIAPDPVLEALGSHSGSMQALAEELGVSRSTLYRRLKKQGRS